MNEEAKERAEDQAVEAAETVVAAPPKNGARGSPESQAWRELLTKPVAWATHWGTEARTLCETRILESGHWNRYLTLRERAKAVHPDWGGARIRKYVMERHFGLNGLIMERCRYWQREERYAPFASEVQLPELAKVREFKRIRDWIPNPLGHNQHGRVEGPQPFTAAQAFNSLPKSSSDSDLDWVCSHPKYFALGQDEDASDCKLTAHDLLESSNGPAPSKRAVTMLQGALADPKKFREQVMSEVKKNAAKSKEGTLDDFGAASDDDMLRLIEQHAQLV